ncbi:hypothetical protein VD0002_g6856 [Verticillium dahliae]|nr:hypothetical protein VD0002_g6856 [Verticillium dahliae]
MFNKQAVTALASLALAKEAVAFNAHRHSHEERDIVHAHTHVEIVTEWVTVTAGPGQPAPSPDYAAPQNPLTTTPTYVVVRPPATVEPPAPVVPPTTLQTAVVATPVTSPKEEGAQDTPKKETSSGSTGTSGGKRGFAYNDASLVKNFFTNGNECTNCPWAYNWDSSDNGLSQPGVEYVPQLWGPIDVHLQRWEQNVASSIKAGSTHILSFNECDMPSQCNLDASSAADAHIKHVNPFSKQVKIGSPAVTNSNIPGQGLDWLKAWVDACDAKGCVYDFCVVHWYSPLEAADTLFTHIKQASEICGGKPVWLTEFAPLSHDDSAVSSWIQTNIPKLDALKELERYSFFMVAEGNGKLISSGGLSGAGKAYASA